MVFFESWNPLAISPSITFKIRFGAKPNPKVCCCKGSEETGKEKLNQKSYKVLLSLIYILKPWILKSSSYILYIFYSIKNTLMLTEIKFLIFKLKQLNILISLNKRHKQWKETLLYMKYKKEFLDIENFFNYRNWIKSLILPKLLGVK